MKVLRMPSLLNFVRDLVDFFLSYSVFMILKMSSVICQLFDILYSKNKNLRGHKIVPVFSQIRALTVLNVNITIVREFRNM